jgi:heme A synthase
VAVAHEILGKVFLVAGVLLAAGAAWSAFAARRSSGQFDHRFLVDRMVLTVLVLVALNGAIGLLLVWSGTRPADPLHWLYGPAALVALPLALALASWRGRGGRASGLGGEASRLRRDAWVIVGAIALIGIAARLFATG